MKSRGVAVIAAFVLIVLAIFIRGLVSGDDDGGGSDGPSKPADGLPVVACTDDLVSICDALATEGLIAENPPLLDLSEASVPDASIDAWITWSPAPAMANFATRPDKVWQTPEVLASGAEAVLIDEASADELPAGCRSKPTWSCLADASPDLSVGVGSPGTAEGVARLAPLARTFTTDDDYTTLDTDGLDDLLGSPPGGQADAFTMAEQVTTQPGSVSMTTGTRSMLEKQTKTPQGEQRGLRVLSPTPSTRLVVVLAERVGLSGVASEVGCDPDPPKALVESVRGFGLQPCEGKADAALAGFLFQVQKKVG